MSNCFYEPTFARDPGGLFRLQYLGYATWELHIKDDSSWTGWSRVMTGGVSHLSTWAGLMKERGLASIPRQLGVRHGGEVLDQIESVRPQLHQVVRGYVGEMYEDRNPAYDFVEVWADGELETGLVQVWAEYRRGIPSRYECVMLGRDVRRNEVCRLVADSMSLPDWQEWFNGYSRCEGSPKESHHEES